MAAAQRAGIWWDGLGTAGLMRKSCSLVPAGLLGPLLLNFSQHLFWRWCEETC